jgi:hypothetical protein
MGVRALLKRIERTEKVFKAQSIFSPDGICFMEKEQPCVCSAFALYRSQTAVNRAIQTCTEGSNPSLSATARWRSAKLGESIESSGSSGEKGIRTPGTLRYT